MNHKVFASSEGNVWKYVFHFHDAISEAVLYRYPDFRTRTVLCVSVQSGCPVGCTFCGTGNRFIRNLTESEIISQISTVFQEVESKENIHSLNSACAKLQIMFMSMGEPFLNYDCVRKALIWLHRVYPNAQLLVSTVAPTAASAMRDFVQLSAVIPKIGLQFSIHKPSDEERNVIIPFKKKLTLREIRNYGVEWWHATGRKPYCNYCVNGPIDNIAKDHLMNLFPANVFCFTFSVICSPDETMKEAGYRNHEVIRGWMDTFLAEGYDVRMFDPAGQDDIGGGCGQLWYVQRYLKGEQDA